MDAGIRFVFVEMLKAAAKDYEAVSIWPGSDVELCCVVAQCECTKSTLVEESRQVQIVNFLLDLLQSNMLEHLIERAISTNADRDGINIVRKVTLPGSVQVR